MPKRGSRDSFADTLRYRWIAFRKFKVQKSARRPNVEPKPFKSGNKVNTAEGICKHPTLDRLCFTFVEDDSYVECWRCEVVR